MCVKEGETETPKSRVSEKKRAKVSLQTDKSGCFMCHGYFRFISSSAALFIALWFDISESMLVDIPHALYFSMLSFYYCVLFVQSNYLSLSSFQYSCYSSHTITPFAHKAKRKFSVFILTMSKRETFLFAILTGKVKRQRIEVE